MSWRLPLLQRTVSRKAHMPPWLISKLSPAMHSAVQVRDGEGEWQTINLDNPEAMKEVHDELRLSLTMPKYTIEGQPITYKVAEAEENKNDRLEYQIPGFEGTDDKDDYFAIKYDNTNATRPRQRHDGVYSGGSVILTLTGTTELRPPRCGRTRAETRTTAPKT